MLLQVKNLSFAYNSSRTILEDISLNVQKSEVLGILGPNGTGKTTFIKCINRILKPQKGEILLFDKNILNLTQTEIAKLIAYVPQYNNSANISVIDTIMMGRLPYAKHGYSEFDKKVVFDILQKIDLEKFAFRDIRELSGGERQRIFIARALAQQPKAIILDEPTSSLDLHNQLFILNSIVDIAKSDGISIIMTIHDLNLAAMFCDTLLMLKNKKIFAYGTPQEILSEDLVNETYKVNTKITIEDGYKHIRLLRK